MVSKWLAAALVLAFVFLGACAQPPAGQDEDLQTRVSELEAENQGLREETAALEEELAQLEAEVAQLEDLTPTDALTWQPHMVLLQREAASYDLSPGMTDWVEVLDSPLSDLSGSTPGEILLQAARTAVVGEEFGSEVVGEVVLRLQRGGEQATGAILRWGLLDDSLAGIDHRLQLRLAADSWSVERVEVRYQCRRGVSGNQCQ